MSEKDMINIVWIKRDIRSCDHLPLYEAELKNLPVEYIHEPWQISDFDKLAFNIDIKYPSPKIDIDIATKRAKNKIWKYRKDPKVRKENKRIIYTHTRNKYASNKT